MEYFFIFGSHYELALAELTAFLRREKKDFRFLGFPKPAAILHIDASESFISDCIKKLGGTIKTGKVERMADRCDVKHMLKSLPEKSADPSDPKVIFGVSVYGEGIKDMGKKMGMSIKKHLKERGYKVRYVESKDTQLSAVSVTKEKLITKGTEYVIIRDGSHFYYGKTLNVFDYELFSVRDYGRPFRDAASGMIPPKLARIMIQLATESLDSKALLIDPFCGSGTFLQEAYLLDFENFICSDISQKALLDSQRNFAWAKRQKLIRSKHEPIFFLSDIKALPQQIQGMRLCDAIITEPYLGPALKHHAAAKELESVKKNVEDLYLRAFEAFRRLLRPQGPVVMVWPAWDTGNGLVRMNILSKIRSLGFEPQDMLPKEYRERNQKHEYRDSDGLQLFYGREYQKVIREIWKFQFQG